jgi:hypothetical protein
VAHDPTVRRSVAVRRSSAARRFAAELHYYFGAEAGVRCSFAEITKQLPTLSQGTLQTKFIVREMMRDWVEAGLATRAPPHGAEGWALTPRGAALIAMACDQ